MSESIKPRFTAEMFLTGQLKFKDIIKYKNGRHYGPLIVIDIFINTRRREVVERKHCKITKKHNYQFKPIYR